MMESSKNVNAGLGAVLQNDGQQRMDASIMSSNLKCGSVASLRGFENPISLAKLISEDQSGHIFYAQDFARDIANLHSMKKINTLESEDLSIQKSLGETVGAVAIDFDRMLAAGTSTGGLPKAQPGRIGDTPIIGAGTYCNKYGAVSNTGHGEWIVRMNCAKRIVDLIQFNQFSPQAACDRMDIEFSHMCDKILGQVCIDAKGRWGVGIVGASMRWAGIVKDGDEPAMLYYGCGKGEILQQELHP
jgi:beta-aspartyl-peptidase (threonine type)